MRARIAATIALSASIALVATGCAFVTPQATQDDYHPSDGVGATVGDIRMLNALVISGDGEDGNLVANFTNSGSDRARVTVQFEGEGGTQDKTVSVAPGEITSIGTEETFELEGIDVEVGSLFPIFVQYGNETGKQVLVPVLDGSLPEYSELLP